jgi:hypothetical protein
MADDTEQEAWRRLRRAEQALLHQPQPPRPPMPTERPMPTEQWQQQRRTEQAALHPPRPPLPAPRPPGDEAEEPR